MHNCEGIMFPGGKMAGSALVEIGFRVADFARRLMQITATSDLLAVSINFWNASGASIQEAHRQWPEATLVVGPVFIAADELLDSGLRRLFDIAWNAFGVDACPYFDEEGRLTHPA